LNAPATGDGINGMLERARQLSERLKFDPARTGLGWWLALINVVIVLLVVGGI
jgi:hypothetical protein